MPMTTTAQIDPGVNVYYDRNLLLRAKPYQVHKLFGQHRSIPEKNSKTIKMRRYTNLAPAVVPLAEGITPVSTQLSKTDIQATLSTYGAVVTITDEIELTVEDDVLNETSQLLAQQMGETLDVITRDILNSTAAVIDASAGVNGNTPTEITQQDIDTVVVQLKNNNGRKLTPMIEGENKFATSPLRASYWGIISTELYRDLKAVTSFQSVANYPKQLDVLEPEVGSTDDVRWVETSLAYKTNGSPTIYSNFITARDGYGCIDLDGNAAEMIIRPFGTGDDYLYQRAHAGFKARYVARVLNDTWIINLRTTAA